MHSFTGTNRPTASLFFEASTSPFAPLAADAIDRVISSKLADAQRFVEVQQVIAEHLWQSG